MYDPDREAGVWSRLSDAPGASVPSGSGAGLATAMRGDTPMVYLLKGPGRAGFACYNTVASRWEQLPAAPLGNYRRPFRRGGCLASDGQPGLYYLEGPTNRLCRYNTGPGVWRECARLPFNGGRSRQTRACRAGTGIAFRQGQLHLVKGGTFDYWAYDPASDAWQQLSGLPLGPSVRPARPGAAFVAADNSICILKGNRTREFFAVMPLGTVVLARGAVDDVASSRIGEAGPAQVELFPNPCQGRVTLRGLRPGQQVDVFDVAGHRLGSWRLAADCALDLRGRVPRGVYLLRLATPSGQVQHKLILK